MASNKNTFGSIEALRSLSVSAGSVFLGPWKNIDHEKFVVVAGVGEERMLVCTVFINSGINQYILKRPKMLACQLEIKASDYDFLSHDSYINCAQPSKAAFHHFTGDDFKYCGLLSDKDLFAVQQQIIASGTLTNEEIQYFFGKR